MFNFKIFHNVILYKNINYNKKIHDISIVDFRL